MFVEMINGMNFLNLGPTPIALAMAACLAIPINIREMQEGKYKNAALTFTLISAMLMSTGIQIHIVAMACIIILVGIYYLAARGE